MGDVVKVQQEDPELVCKQDTINVGEAPAGVVMSHNKSLPGTKKVGVGGDSLIQSVPEAAKGGGDKHFVHENFNGGIYFCGDRPRGRLSGYGGVGVRNSNTIDICVGRMGPSPRTVTKTNKKIFVDNNFAIDSARIYISQRSDVDRNLALQCDLVEPASNCSCIFLKADAIRLVGRRDIRIVSGVDYHDSRGSAPSVNYSVPHRICLIGDNKDHLLQPMVKGENLVEFLIEYSNKLTNILSIIDTFLTHQNDINQALFNHVHVTGLEGTPTPPSFSLITDTQCKSVQLLADVKSSTLEMIGDLEGILLEYTDVPEDGTNELNILSNYNFCN